MKITFQPLLVVLLCTISFYGKTQIFLSNPSFEGNRGVGIIPFSWSSCDANSSPDTQPGAWGVTELPSQGVSYSNLVTLGDLGPYRHTTEDMSTVLLQNLTAGEKYKISIDLANAKKLGHYGGGQWISYSEGVKLDISLGTSLCDMTNQVWQSPPVNHNEWRKYEFEIEPTQDYSSLSMKAVWASSPDYFGHILIDNMTIELIKEVDTIIPEPLDTLKCEVNMPNVFTPNGDGYNDALTFMDGNRSALIKAEFSIYDRWGVQLYSSNELEISWDGKDNNGWKLQEGLYYWDLKYSCFNGQLTEKQKKGWVQILK